MRWNLKCKEDLLSHVDHSNQCTFMQQHLLSSIVCIFKLVSLFQFMNEAGFLVCKWNLLSRVTKQNLLLCNTFYRCFIVLFWGGLQVYDRSFSLSHSVLCDITYLIPLNLNIHTKWLFCLSLVIALIWQSSLFQSKAMHLINKHFLNDFIL